MRCKAKSKRSGEQCGNPAMDGFDVCRMHGGAGAKKNLRPGNLSGAEIRTRKQFLEALSGERTEFVHQLIQELQRAVKAGDTSSVRYCVDQIFGAPKTTVVTEIGSRDLFARFVKATAKHLTGEAFEAWLLDLKKEMAPD